MRAVIALVILGACTGQPATPPPGSNDPAPAPTATAAPSPSAAPPTAAPPTAAPPTAAPPTAAPPTAAPPTVPPPNATVDLAHAQVEYSAKGFWTTFRAVALAGDLDPVVALTAFPFKTRGMMDDDVEHEYDEQAFRALWPKLLASDPGLGKGDQKAMIEATDAPPADAGDSFRIGDFRFEKRGKAWRLVMAYFDPDL